MTAETIDEQQDYGLLFHFTNPEGVLDKLNELLATGNINELWQDKRQKLLSDKIDVTAFTLWFIENFPESLNLKFK